MLIYAAGMAAGMAAGETSALSDLMLAGASRERYLRRADWFVFGLVLLYLFILQLSPRDGFESLASYPLLHGLLDLGAGLAAVLAFALGWNAYTRQTPANLLLLACGLLAVGLTHLSHLVPLDGLQYWAGPRAAPWPQARPLLAAVLLAAVLLPWRPFARPGIRHGLLGASLAVAVLGYCTGGLPFAPPATSTQPFFVLGVEYLGIGMYSLAAVALLVKSRSPQPFDVSGLLAGVCILMLSELCFLRPPHGQGVFGLLGHVYQLLAYLLLYRVVRVDSVAPSSAGLKQLRQPLPWRENECARAAMDAVDGAKKGLREEGRRLRTLLDAMPEVVCFKDGEGRLLEANQFGLRLFGLEGAAYQGKNPLELAAYNSFRREAYLACAASDEQVWREAKPVREEAAIRIPGGTAVYDMVKVPLFHPDGRRNGLVIAGRDITREKTLERERQQLISILEASPDLVRVSRLDGGTVYVNTAWRDRFGDGPDRCSPENIHPAWAVQMVEEGVAMAARDGVWRGETAIVERDGREIPVSHVVVAHDNPDGSVAFLSTILRDVSELRESESRLHHLAHHDPVTGLPNRFLIRDRLGQALVQARRRSLTVAVLFLDLDRFKTINDTLGHDFGDLLLKDVAQRIGGCIRESDSVGRLGGDEFMIVLPDLAKGQDSIHVCQTMVGAFSRPFAVDGRELFVTCSIGVSLFPNDGGDRQTLIRNADTALYRAKELGRNNYQFYTADMNARAFERLALENDLRKALEREELRVYYQPKVSLESGEITGAEALVRWLHPDLGLIAPNQFIPLAEESGLIVPIGEYVLRSACAQNQSWREAGLAPINVAVNLSARQLREAGFISTVSGVLEETGLAPGCLELELTESMLMQSVEGPAAVLGRLKELGILLAMDDFGTGFSSLSYLKRFPIDQLKIDRSFIKDVVTDTNDGEIVRAIIAMGRSLKLKLVAEGVEEREQMEFLRAHGCDEMQGYYFSAPLPAADFTDLLRRHRIGSQKNSLP